MIVPRPPQLGARRAEREEALVVVEHAAAVAAGARRRCGARLGAAAVAGRAGRLGHEVDRRLDPVDRVEERQVQLGLEVVAALGPGPARRAPGRRVATPAATEQPAEQVVDVGRRVGEGAIGAGPAPESAAHAAHATHGTELAHLVVLLALGLVAHDVVGGRDLLEAVFGARIVGVGVGMQLAGQLAVRARDLLLGRGVRDAERLVVVLLEPFALWRQRPALLFLVLRVWPWPPDRA